MDDLTGLDGYATGTVVTSGLPVTAAGDDSGYLVLPGVGATSDPVSFVVQLSALQASPSAVGINCAGSLPTTISVRALGPDGSALPGVDISATCTASGGDGATLEVDPASATTGSNGSAVFVVTATGFVGAGSPPALGTGQCTFSASDSSRSVTVNFRGVTVSPTPVCN
jgi:hypothetical protein